MNSKCCQVTNAIQVGEQKRKVVADFERWGMAGAKARRREYSWYACRALGSFRLGFCPSCSPHIPTVPDTEQAFSNYLVDEYVCVWISEGTRGPEEEGSKRGDDARKVGALNPSLRNSGSSCHLGAHCGGNRREIWAEPCFSAIDLGQCAEWTSRRKCFQKTRHLGPKSSGPLCKCGEGIKGKVITMRWKECGIWSRQT